MTREEWYEEYPEMQWITKLVIDDFESRTCENCFYYNKDVSTFGEYEASCSNMIIEEKDLLTVRYDFGCNKYERIEDEDKTME